MHNFIFAIVHIRNSKLLDLNDVLVGPLRVKLTKNYEHHLAILCLANEYVFVCIQTYYVWAYTGTWHRAKRSAFRFEIAIVLDRKLVMTNTEMTEYRIALLYKNLFLFCSTLAVLMFMYLLYLTFICYPYNLSYNADYNDLKWHLNNTFV